MNRHDDKNTNKPFFRSDDRAFRLNNSWYFSTREGDQGPYFSRELAIKELQRYVDEKCSLGHFQRSREAFFNKGMETEPKVMRAVSGNLALEVCLD